MHSNKFKFIIPHGESLKNVAKEILKNTQKTKVLLLNGELGNGKTALVKEIAKQIGIEEKITSPSFNYIKVYDGLVHIDAYNLTGNLDEFEDYFEDNIIAIEWANLLDIRYNKYIKIDIVMDEENNHIFNLEVVE
ncbi:tRNA (adenosine(37)-N6)-threonylcarbamoyltransferase complex ATPase subunit type 1 TsaE [Mycoplasmopsis opalescens]|uniref:tRNA (adenosine(37)-N6)-threonylcarbamoyltransferase complex ATPase subunit type 1 TsaE n=1 Tax=Mycoplasmopsis opalescens TaxID=114886 RepID=UPI0004A71240|nr:tRNA (adenosine(37)-N6)-threonylcarbamoyltransferase complex ATPase subunit type 1 TsaE [Mycoplasmopsis opalescens]